MELIAAFLTGVVGPIAYFFVNNHLAKQKDKGRDKVKETITDSNLITDELEEMREEFKCDRVRFLSFIMVVTFIPQVNQSKNSQYSMK